MGASGDEHGQQSRVLLLARIVGLALITIAALRITWMSDDALITLRHALNISNGWGPGFNATESVQGYTHPLWFLLWLLIGQAGHWVIGILLFSVLLTAVAVFLALKSATSVPRVVLISGLLLLSNAFMEFTTSGLENPLAYLTVGVLITLTLRQRRDLVWAIALGLTSAAIVLTRFDLAVLIIPVLLWQVWRLRDRVRLVGAMALAAVVPVVLWLSWTFVTYQSLLPNTFAAKQNAEIPRTELIVQGFRYLWVTFEHDPVSLFALILGLGAAIFLGPVVARMWAVGAAFYIGYVVVIGGDFMAGRFIAVPVYVAAFLLGFVHWQSQKKASHTSNTLVSVGAVLLIVLIAAVGTGNTPTALANAQEARWEVDQNFNAGVADARGTSVGGGMAFKGYLDQLSLAYVSPITVPFGDGTGLARTLRDINRTATQWPTNDDTTAIPSEVAVACGFLGNIGIVVGPTVHMIDTCALTDRFLAERPFRPAEPFAWKPGHLHREVPNGYLEALAFNDASLMADPADAFYLAQLWERIRPPK